MTAASTRRQAVAGDEDDLELAPRPSWASRVVLLVGITVGTALVVLDEWDGVRLRIGGMPSWLGYACGALLAWLACIGLAWWAAAMVRHHHRAMARGAGRAAVATGRAGRRHGGWLAAWVHARAAGRWRGRGDTWRDPAYVPVAGDDAGRRWIFRGRDQDQVEDDSGVVHPPDPPDPMLRRIHDAIRVAWGADDTPPVRVSRAGDGMYRADLPPGVLNTQIVARNPVPVQTKLSHALGEPALIVDCWWTPEGATVVLQIPARGPADPSPAGDLPGPGDSPRQICVACGHPATRDDPLVRTPEGWRVHRSHTTDPASGLYDPAAAPAAAGTEPNGDQDDMTTDAAGPAVEPVTHLRPGGRAAVPPRWNALNNDVADYEATDDADLMSWFAGEVAGLAGHADALISFYETCVDSRGLDPAAMHAVHDAADAAAETARAVAAARKKFAAHYAEVREFAAGGGVLPHDARTWITGEDG